ncbi:MAG: hypothetical protein IT379_07100 [Deltaproteobacteria bacterium]|nr:hypothetical protein [Deltaproteobacteria bacterium]
MHRVTALGGALSLGLLFLAATASAQQPQPQPTDDTAQRAAARALFEEGVAFAEQRQFENAVDRFRRSRELRRVPVVTYNLAVALAELRQLVEASELLRGVIRDETTPPELRQSAQVQLSQILPRVGRLTIRLSGDRSGVLVVLDDRPIAPALIGVAAPIDPGQHRVVARRAGRDVASQVVDVTEGRDAAVTLEVEPALPQVRDIGGVELETEASGPSRQRPRRRREPERGGGGGVLGQWWFWGIVGVVAAGATTGIIVAASSGGTEEPVRGTFMPGSLDIR